MAKKARVKWVGKLEYLFTELGYTIGLGNIWRFPYRCYINGGGTFLIPYLLSVVLCAIPVLFLEMFLGQFTSNSAVAVWDICPLFKGLGWAILFNISMVCIYYSVLIMYAFYYMIVSFASIGSELPWLRCRKPWSTNLCRDQPIPNLQDISGTEDQKIQFVLSIMDKQCVNNSTNHTFSQSLDELKNLDHCVIKFTSPEEEYWNRFVLGVHESKDFNHIGSIHIRNSLCLLVIWIFTLYCCLRGIRSIAKATYFTATLPILLLVILLVRGLTLDGNWIGLQYYTTADWRKLSNMAIWYNAASQAVYSISIATGNHIVFASYNDFNKDLIRDGLILGIANSLVSIFGGFVVFMFLGHTSFVLNHPMGEMVNNGPGLIFIAYIKGMTYLPESALWCFFFFMMVFFLGLDSLFGHIWTFYASLTEVLPDKVMGFGRLFLLLICVIMFLCGLPLTTMGGIHILTMLDTYGVQISRLVSVLAQCIIISWIYGIKNFMEDIELMTGKMTTNRCFYKFLGFALKVTAPVFTTFIIVASALSFKIPEYNNIKTTTTGQVVGWLLTTTPLVIVVAVGATELIKRGPITRQNILQLVKDAMQPAESWGPRLKENRTGKYSSDVEYITPCYISKQTTAKFNREHFLHNPEESTCRYNTVCFSVQMAKSWNTFSSQSVKREQKANKGEMFSSQSVEIAGKLTKEIEEKPLDKAVTEESRPECMLENNVTNLDSIKSTSIIRSYTD